MPGIELGVKGREYRNDLLFGGAEVHLDLVDDAIQGVDGLPRLLLSLGHGDGVVGNLVLEGAGDLAQGAEVMLGMILDATFGANGFSAGLAVAVDFISDVLLTAGNPLHGGISCKGLLKGDLLVRGCGFGFLVSPGAGRAQVFIVVDAVHGGILIFAKITLNHPVDVSLVGLGRFEQGGDKGIAGIGSNSTDRVSEGCPALMAAEVGRTGLGSGLLGLKTGKAEGVQASKGAWFIEGVVANGTLGKLFD